MLQLRQKKDHFNKGLHSCDASAILKAPVEFQCSFCICRFIGLAGCWKSGSNRRKEGEGRKYPPRKFLSLPIF